MVLAILGSAGIAWGMTRWSMNKHAQRNARVAVSDAALMEVARRLGLTFGAGPAYEHPFIGPIAAFGAARGVLDGIAVHVGVDMGSEGDTARTELRAELPGGYDAALLPRYALNCERYTLERGPKTLTLYPVVRKTGSSQFIVYELETEPATIIALLRELVELARTASERTRY